MKTLAHVLVVIVAAAALPSTVVAVEAPKTGEPGRYQLVVGRGETIYLLDTATGRCWSKSGSRHWEDEGCPFEERAEKPREPLTLELPRETVDLVVRQRGAKSIPGSDDRIRVHIGDITAGRTVLSVRTDGEEMLADEVLVAQGENVAFEVNGRRYLLKVGELNNQLIGQDLAVLEISVDDENDDDAEKDADTSTGRIRDDAKRGDRQRDGDESAR